MFTKLKKKWEKLLDSIAEQNKATYGAGGINCCELKNVNQAKQKYAK